VAIIGHKRDPISHHPGSNWLGKIPKAREPSQPGTPGHGTQNKMMRRRGCSEAVPGLDSIEVGQMRERAMEMHVEKFPAPSHHTNRAQIALDP
jgi:hypothetical protein